jgi:ribosome biogenesis GTPase
MAGVAVETKCPGTTTMIEIDFERLRSLGLTPALAADAAGLSVAPAESGRLMRLIAVHRETVDLHDGERELSARLWPRLLHELDAEQTALAVGDWVVAAADANGGRWVVQRLPPHSHIARRDADGRRHAVVSNVDIALLVMGLDDDFNPRRLERYLALVQASGVRPVVVLTKTDIAAKTPGRIDERLASLRGRVPTAIEIIAVDATAPSTALVLGPYLEPGRTLVVLGSSGAGKSTLTNTLLGTRTQDTGAVRESDGRGMHTTTSRSLHRLPGGACVIDTPGVRTLRPDTDEETLAASFEDIEALSARCRFRDCRHADEPGCAVRAGVDADRLRNYQKLLRESRRDTLGVVDRQRQAAVWKARGRATRAWMKMKRGEA